MSITGSTRLAALFAILLAAPQARAAHVHVHVGGGGPVVHAPVRAVAPAPGVHVVHPPPPGGPHYWVAPRYYYRPWYAYRPWYGYYPYSYYGYPYFGFGFYGYAGPLDHPVYYPAYPAPVGTVVGYQERDPIIGLGLRGTAVHAGSDHPSSAGIGALLRFRARPVELELELGWDTYNQNVARNDTRVATSLYVPIFGRELQPYLVVGGGINFAYFGGTGDVLHQGFLDGGAGLALNFSRHLTLSGDVRYAVRHYFDDIAVVARQPLSVTVYPGPVAVSRFDEAVEFRSNLIVYF
jgi:hypothetical protein